MRFDLPCLLLLCLLTLTLPPARIHAAARPPQCVVSVAPASSVPAPKATPRPCTCGYGCACGRPDDCRCPPPPPDTGPGKGVGVACTCGATCACQTPGRCGDPACVALARQREEARGNTLDRAAARALAENKPLLLWVGVVCLPCERKMPGYVHCRLAEYDGYSGVEHGPCVLVFRKAEDGEMRKVARLDGIPSAEAVRDALAPKAAPVVPPAQVMAPVMRPMMMPMGGPMMGGFGGGFGGCSGGG